MSHHILRFAPENAGWRILHLRLSDDLRSLARAGGDSEGWARKNQKTAASHLKFAGTAKKSLSATMLRLSATGGCVLDRLRLRSGVCVSIALRFKCVCVLSVCVLIAFAFAF